MNTQVPILLASLLVHSVCGSYSGQAHNYGGNEGHYGHGDLRYHGPTAIPHVLHDGHTADTHEVAAAKAEHYKAVASAKSHSGYGHGDSYDYETKGHEFDSNHPEAHHTVPYHGPLAKPVVLKSGYLADTHEVSAVKAAHNNAVVTAKAHSGYGSEGSYRYGGGYQHGGDYEYTDGGSYLTYGHDSSSNHHTTPYQGPLAKPTVLKSGYLADTHEVSAVKAAHNNAVVTAKAHSGYGSEGSYRYGGGYQHGGDYEYTDGGSYLTYGHDSSSNHHTTPYQGPLAKPTVLKSGYLADTHEVAAAKEHHLSALHSAPMYYNHEH